MFLPAGFSPRMADSPWTGSDDGQESPFPFVLLHHLILAQGTPVRLTCHHQWMHKFAIITVTVTKALIEEELEEEGSLLIQLLADKTPTLLLNVTPPSFHSSRGSPLFTPSKVSFHPT